jgi:NDP-sugar pyrophosphorylase family protein
VSLPVAILAGGLATRLRPLTEHIPKILVDVNGRPVVEHQIALLRRNGIERVLFCLGHLGEQVQEAIGNGSRWGMRFSYSFDGESLRGTGGAIRQALADLGDAFFVLYGDSYLECSFALVEAGFRQSGLPALMTVFRNDNQWDRSNVAFVGSRVVKYDKFGGDSTLRWSIVNWS